MENKNLVRVYGCYTCKHLAGELRKQQSTYKEELNRECCFLCDADLDFFYLNTETMCFQKGIVITDEEDDIMSQAQAVAHIMQTSGVDEDTAKKIYMEIKLEHVTKTCEELKEKGLAEVFKIETDGTPCYRLTKAGEEFFNTDKLT